LKSGNSTRSIIEKKDQKTIYKAHTKYEAKKLRATTQWVAIENSSTKYWKKKIINLSHFGGINIIFVDYNKFYCKIIGC
jgi:hypothetical protein